MMEMRKELKLLQEGAEGIKELKREEYKGQYVPQPDDEDDLLMAEFLKNLKN